MYPHSLNLQQPPGFPCAIPPCECSTWQARTPSQGPAGQWLDPGGRGQGLVPSQSLMPLLPQVIFGKSSCSEFTRSLHTVVYHNKYMGWGGGLWGTDGQEEECGMGRLLESKWGT